MIKAQKVEDSHKKDNNNKGRGGKKMQQIFKNCINYGNGNVVS